MKGSRRARTAALLLVAIGSLVPAAPAQAAATVTQNTQTIDFGDQRVGTFGSFEQVTFTFGGDADTTVTAEYWDGAHAIDYLVFHGETPCMDDPDTPKTFNPGDTCDAVAVFLPTERGGRTARLVLETDAPGSPHDVALNGNGTVGYYFAGAAGQVAGFGDAEDFGDASDADLNQPVVGLATTSNGDGYWLVARDGGIFAFGNAAFHGSTGAIALNQPIVGMASTPTGLGYWLVAADGGIFAFGDADFFGSTGATPLNQPVVGMAPTPTGQGYWLVARDGGIFAFGDADFFGSTGGTPLNEPVVGMAPTPSGRGYHLVASDGGIFSFGDAQFHGSTGGIELNLPVTGMAEYPNGQGYWLVAVDGGVFAFGNAPFLGSLGGQGVNDVVGIASTSPPVDLSVFGARAAGGGRMSVTSGRPRLPAGRRATTG